MVIVWLSTTSTCLNERSSIFKNIAHRVEFPWLFCHFSMSPVTTIIMLHEFSAIPLYTEWKKGTSRPLRPYLVVIICIDCVCVGICIFIKQCWKHKKKKKIIIFCQELVKVKSCNQQYFYMAMASPLTPLLSWTYPKQILKSLYL